MYPQQYWYDTQQSVGIISTRSHNDRCILTAGRKQTTVQYWSLHDNKILRKFRGHTSSVYEINVCPTEDLFLTASKDQTVRLWNLQQAGCLAKMDLPKDSVGTSTQPRAVFDSTGMVFTVLAEMAGGEGHYIHLYDARNYQGGAFSELKLTSKAVNEAMVTHRVPPPPPKAPGVSPLTLNKISFNVSGNRILVHASEGYALVLDGYEGAVQRIFRSSRGNALVSCFTPDEKSLLVGSDSDGLVDVYDIQSGRAVKTLEGGHGTGSEAGAVTSLACNPKYAQIASGGPSNTRCASNRIASCCGVDFSFFLIVACLAFVAMMH
jgi:COMPASS component SWD2